MTDSSHPNLRSGQVAIGAILSALVCLTLLLLQRRFERAASLGDFFFSYWSQYVCGLFTFWAILLLTAKWRTSVERDRCLRKFPASEPASLITEAHVEELMTAFSEAGRSCRDEMLAKRTNGMIEQVRSSSDAAVALSALDTQIARSLQILDSEYSAVRIFCWTIPALGFVGTVLALGQVISRFAMFLAAGEHTPEDVRKALSTAETNLASGSHPLLIAVLLTVVVAALSAFVGQKEREVLGQLDDICRSFVLALARWQPAHADAQSSTPQNDFGTPDHAVEATLYDLRAQIQDLSPALHQLIENLRQHSEELSDSGSLESQPRAREVSAGG